MKNIFGGSLPRALIIRNVCVRDPMVWCDVCMLCSTYASTTRQYIKRWRWADASHKVAYNAHWLCTTRRARICRSITFYTFCVCSLVVRSVGWPSLSALSRFPSSSVIAAPCVVIVAVDVVVVLVIVSIYWFRWGFFSLSSSFTSYFSRLLIHSMQKRKRNSYRKTRGGA